MTVGGENLGGQGRMALLALVGTHGSITHAAKAMGMSYKAAWDAIDTMNNLAGEPLVERLTGGKGGGGTRLTTRASNWCRTSGSSRPSTGVSSPSLDQQATGIADDFVDQANQYEDQRTQPFCRHRHACGARCRQRRGGDRRAPRPEHCCHRHARKRSRAGLWWWARSICAGQGIVHRGGERCRRCAFFRTQPPGGYGFAHHAGCRERRVVIDIADGVSIAAIITPRPAKRWP